MFRAGHRPDGCGIVLARGLEDPSGELHLRLKLAHQNAATAPLQLPRATFTLRAAAAAATSPRRAAVRVEGVGVLGL